MEIDWHQFLVDFSTACYSGRMTGKPTLIFGDSPIHYQDEARHMEAVALAKSNIANNISLAIGMGWKRRTKA